MLTDEWVGTWDLTLTVSRERTFGDCDDFEDEHPEYTEAVRRAFEHPMHIKASVRRERNGKILRPGLKAGSVNQAIREAMGQESPVAEHPWTYEADAIFEGVRNAALVDALSKSEGKTIGFDFCHYDVRQNVAMVRNLLVLGRRDFLPDSMADSELERQISHLVSKRPHWLETWRELRDLNLPPGWLCSPPRQAPCVVGEIQAGNWALATQDIAKLGLAEEALDLDQFLYVTPDGLLSETMSGGTVNYEGFSERFEKIGRSIRTPVRVFGIEIQSINRRVQARAPKADDAGQEMADDFVTAIERVMSE